MTARLVDLRKYAAGRACYVRLPGCDGGGETTVLAHLRQTGISGIGYKAPDLLACPSCARCHDLADSRAHMANLTRSDVKLAHLEGIARWQADLIREGVVVW